VNRYLRVAVAIVLALAATAAPAATSYVTDQLRISVRTGAGNQYRIIEVIPTGTRVDTLETSGEWARVRVPSGKTGWVRTQYLDDEPVAAQELKSARAELEDAKSRAAELESSLADTRDQLGTARQRVQALTDANEALKQKLAGARQGLEMHEDNVRLKKTTVSLQHRIETLEGEVSRLTDRSRQRWFMIGGGVLLAGILFGIVVTRIPWRSRKDRLF